MDFIFATHNPGKVQEVRGLFAERGYTVNGLPPHLPEGDPAETGASFAENARLKARYYAERLESGRRAAVFSDDSGLAVDALGGQPGVYSARYLGEDTPYDYKNRHIIHLLRDTPDEKRTARFICAMACFIPAGAGFRLVESEGAVEGRIARAPRGDSGFGYDPIFWLPQYGLTTAELSLEEKNKISHRGHAIRALLDQLRLL